VDYIEGSWILRGPFSEKEAEAKLKTITQSDTNWNHKIDKTKGSKYYEDSKEISKEW
jgi:hypothetical protein